MRKAYIFVLIMLIAINSIVFYYQNCAVGYVQSSDVWGNVFTVEAKKEKLAYTILQSLPKNPEHALSFIEGHIYTLNSYLYAVEAKNGDKSALLFWEGNNDEQTEKAELAYTDYLQSKYKDNMSGIEDEASVCELLLKKIKYIIGYSEYIEKIPETADMLSDLQLYKESGGWIFSNIIKTKKDFYGLEQIPVSIGMDSGYNLFVNNRISDIFAVLLTVLSSVIFMGNLREKTGKNLTAEKYSILKGAVFLSFSILILYVVTAFLTENFIGLGDLSRNIQSSESFKNSTLVISTGMFLCLLIFSKTTACCILYFFTVFIIASAKDKRSVIFNVIPTVLFLIAEFILYSAAVNVKQIASFKEVNLFSAFNLQRFFTGYYNLNFFGQAVSRMTTFTVFISILLILSVLLARKKITVYKLKIQTEAERIYFDEINNRYTEFRRIWHDMQNHLLVLTGLIENNDSVSAKKYIDEFNDRLGQTILPVKTGQYNSAVLDALLFKKVETARNKGIRIDFDINASPASFGISDYEICSIFGNILDNAIEAAEKLPYDMRSISVLTRKQNDMLYISCENPYEHEPIRQKEGFLTTKHDKGSHGIGLPRIRSIVKKHKGTVNITALEKRFRIEILLNSKN